MGSYRHERIDEDITRELTLVIRRLKDPRIPQFVSVTSAHVTPDLKYCKAYVGIMGDEKVKKAAMEGLKSAAGYIRREIASKLNLRITPEISFAEDNSLDYAVKINSILKSIEEKENEKNEKEREEK